jgi:hypothetical protein
MDVSFITRKPVNDVQELATYNPTYRTYQSESEHQYCHNRGYPSEATSFQPPHNRREQECKNHCQSKRNQNLPAKVKTDDYNRDSDERQYSGRI